MEKYHEEIDGVKTIRQMTDGIYFDMPFIVYMAQEAFSTSKVNSINDSVLKHWTDEIEPTLQPDFDLDAKLQDATDSMAEGHAWHVMALEGPEAFDALYTAGYDASVYPDALKSKDEHIAACENNGVEFKKSWSIALLQGALIDAGVSVQFHSVLKAEHEAALGDRTIFEIDKLNELKRAGEVIRQYKLDDDLLSGGYPEVSILVTIKGVRYKVRVDYLKPDMQVEYKTLSVRSRKKLFDEVCAAQMHDFGYFTGAYLYTICVNEARRLIRNEDKGIDTGFNASCADIVDADWLDKFANAETHEYWHFFQERGKYNHVLPRRFDKYDEALQSRKIQAIWRTGKLAVERAVKLHAWYMENNGLEKMWLPRVDAKAWADDDFKPWQIEE